MLSSKTGKAELCGSAAVFTVRYLGCCDVKPSAAAADPAFRTEAAVRSLWTDCETARRQLRKSYIVVTTEGVKLHVRKCKASPTQPEQNLVTPLARMPYFCVEVGVDPRLFAWVEHLLDPSQRPSFQCHAVAFPRADLAERMLRQAQHFTSAVHCDQHWARARQLRRRGADAARAAGAGTSDQARRLAADADAEHTSSSGPSAKEEQLELS